MATQLQIRRGTAAQVAAFTGAEGEIVYNSTNDSLHTNDGATAGGFELARVDGSNFSSNVQFTSLTASGEIAANGGIALGDNDKATFGDGDDLQIYHDGSASYIKDLGTGPLAINTNGSEIMLTGQSGGEYMLRAIQDGAVELYHDAAKKLATTATGIDVTGYARIGTGTTTPSLLTLYPSVSAKGWQISANNYVPSALEFTCATTNGGTTFTTPSMVLDASGNVGIGTNSPSDKLTIKAASAHLRLQGTSNINKNVSIQYNESGDYGQINCDEAGVNQKDLWMTGLNLKFGRSTGSESMVLDANGNLGLGTSSPVSFGANTSFFTANGTSSGNGYACQVAGTNYGFMYASTNLLTIAAEGASTQLAFATNNATRMLLDTNGNLGIGTAPFAWTGSSQASIDLGSWGAIIGGSTFGTVVAGNVYNDGTNWRYKLTANANSYIQDGNHRWSTAAVGTGGTVAAMVEHMRLDTSGKLILSNGNIQGSGGVKFSSDINFATTKAYTFRDGVGIDNPNGSSYTTATASVICVGAMSTSRSINATGTINASGADYAEYENNGGLAIAKGDIVGFKADGKLTLTFNEAIRFAVKSTDPSYVGGDTWADEEPPTKNTVEWDEWSASEPEKETTEWDEWSSDEPTQVSAEWDSWYERIEAKRALVDRIAYSGKVPVNIQGATAGDYIIAVAADDGSIDGQAVSDPDFSQYKLSVGRVNRILEDGRAEIAVIIH